MQNARFFAFPLIVLSVFSLAVMGSKQSTSKPITKEEADAAIKAWMGAFVGLSDADSAEAFITKFYAYGSVETMFKPTTAASSTQKADAVAYFTKQGPMMALATGPPAYDVKTFINDPSGNGFAYGQWTLSLKAVPPPVKEKLDMAKPFPEGSLIKVLTSYAGGPVARAIIGPCFVKYATASAFCVDDAAVVGLNMVSTEP